jgi:hypothetical protein
MRRWRRTAVELFLMVAIGIIMALIAPFGTAAMQPGIRLVSWPLFILAGYVIFRPVSALGNLAAAETRLPRWLTIPLIALVASLPLAALIAFARGGMQFTEEWFGERFLTLYAQVAGLGVAIHLLMLFLFPAQRQVEPASAREPSPKTPSEPEREPEPAGTDAFLRRLPPAIGRDLLCLEMQDHYVEAHTSGGSALLLMRLRDAAAELGDAGLQVHRSWWVAHGAVEAVEQEERRTLLRLRGGRRVPVSRASLPQVRAALGDRAGA